MTETISAVEAVDVRFPTSREREGSDAMNPEPDYSAAYVTIRTSAGQEGPAWRSPWGGNELQVAAMRALAPLVVGLPVTDALADLGGFSRRLTGDAQLRWLGPQNGVIHMAAGGIVNAMWDLYARREGKPVWRLLAVDAAKAAGIRTGRTCGQRRSVPASSPPSAA
jgi:L-fuconate dehydratase